MAGEVIITKTAKVYASAFVNRETRFPAGMDDTKQYVQVRRLGKAEPTIKDALAISSNVERIEVLENREAETVFEVTSIGEGTISSPIKFFLRGDGRVYCEGTINASAITTAVTLFTLPQGFYPINRNQTFNNCIVEGAGLIEEGFYGIIQGNGVFTVRTLSASGSFTGRITFDGLVFRSTN